MRWHRDMHTQFIELKSFEKKFCAWKLHNLMEYDVATLAYIEACDLWAISMFFSSHRRSSHSSCLPTTIFNHFILTAIWCIKCMLFWEQSFDKCLLVEAGLVTLRKYSLVTIWVDEIRLAHLTPVVSPIDEHSVCSSMFSSDFMIWAHFLHQDWICSSLIPSKYSTCYHDHRISNNNFEER